jgi:signal transduction histidine kinase
MNELMNHAGHILHFDGIIHWCFLIAVACFVIGLLWVIFRILLPLRRLARHASDIIEGKLPAFDASGGGIREIERLRVSLQHMVAQIKTAQERETAYRNALTETQENERKRIARDIHDDTIQSLVLVGHSLERAMGTHTADDQHLVTARTQLVQTIDNLRQMIVNLRPTILDELGLAAAIEVLCERHARLEFSVVGQAYAIDQAQELAIFRAAQEAVYNAERHARARRITATLTYSKSAVTLEVCDDGVGFEIPRQFQEFAMRGHYGLIGIRERILHLGGQLNLISERATGTRVTVTVPG